MAELLGRKTMNERKHWRPYLEYLARLGKQREQAGLLPAPDIAPPEYWDKRRKDEADKQLPFPKAA
jgi:hypothetical protein